MQYSVSRVFNRLFDRVRPAYLHDFKIGLVLFFAPMAVLYILLYSVFPELLSVSESVTYSVPALIASAVVGVISWLLAVVYLGSLLTGQLTKNPSQLQQGVSLSPKLLLLQIVEFLPFMFAVVLFFALSFVSEILALVVLFAGIITFMVLLTYWAVSYVLLADNAGIIESLKKSVGLVSGRWWRVFATTLLFGLSIVLLNVVFTFPVELVVFFLPSTQLIIAGEVFSQLMAVALVPLSAAFLVSVYDELTATS